jgi:diguanylate cyclase (GGDEF)-like protein
MAPSRDQNDGFSRLQDKQAALQAIVQVMAGSVQLDVLPVFEEALNRVLAALKAPMAALHLLGGEEDKLTLVHQQGLDPVWSLAWANLSLDSGTPPVKVYSDGTGLELAGPEAPQGLDAVVTAPVRGADIGLGALSVLWSGGDGFGPDSERLPFLETVGHLLGLAIEHAGLVSELVDSVNELRQLKDKEEQRSQELAELNQRLHEANIKLEELSITDELTGLFNRRHFIQRLEEEILRSQRQRHPVSLVMADLDHFKRINDTLGHQTGDEALKQFADWLKNGVRRVDTVGRYGGEEFVIVLVDCGPARALKVADKLRREVARRSQVPPFDKLGGFTVSMGVTSLIAGDGTQDLIQRADQALYAAKEKGRNMVVAA